MTIHRKKDKPFHTKKDKLGKDLEKQQLSDLQRRISLNVGNFLVLIEEGTKEQMSLAEQKAKSELLKFGPDMKKLAGRLGEAFAKDVDDYLDSVDVLVHCGISWIDEAKISQYHNTTQKLVRGLI